MLTKPRPFAWSYSKLKNYITCPKRHYEVDILKNYQDSSEALDWGKEVHDAMKLALTGGKLPPELNVFQHWVDRVLAGPGKLLVEQKLAMTADFQKTAWFAPNVWFRTVVDAMRLDPPVALGIDWKTGKVTEDSVQLALTAQVIFAHYPEVEAVRTEFIWLKDDDNTPDVFRRPDMADLWRGLLPKVQEMEHAAATLTYPPRPGRLCERWCPVTSCPHNGKRN